MKARNGRAEEEDFLVRNITTAPCPNKSFFPVKAFLGGCNVKVPLSSLGEPPRPGERRQGWTASRRPWRRWNPALPTRPVQPAATTARSGAVRGAGGAHRCGEGHGESVSRSQHTRATRPSPPPAAARRNGPSETRAREQRRIQAKGAGRGAGVRGRLCRPHTA